MEQPALTTCLTSHMTRRRQMIVGSGIVFLIGTASLSFPSPQLQAAPMRVDPVTTVRLPRPCTQRSDLSPTYPQSAACLDETFCQNTTPTTPAGIGILALLLALLGWARRRRKP